MTPLRIGLLGSGGFAAQHARRIAAQPDTALVAVCGRQQDRAEAVGRPHGATAYVDFARMLREARLDALYVCLPPYAHVGQVEQAANAGIHLFLEKPIALDLTRGRAIVEAIERAGVISQVGYHMRFGAASRAVQQALANGSAGIPTLFQASWMCNNVHSEWWRDQSRSGGQLLEQVIHLYDLACWWLGEPVAVSASTANLCHGASPGYTVEDTSAAMVRFASGAMAAITGSNCAIPMEWTGRWQIVCGALTAHFDDYNHALLVHTGSAGGGRESIASDVDPYTEETREFLAAIRGTSRTSVPAREGLRSLQLCTAALESARQGGRLITLT